MKFTWFRNGAHSRQWFIVEDTWKSCCVGSQTSHITGHSWAPVAAACAIGWPVCMAAAPLINAQPSWMLMVRAQVSATASW